MNQLLLLMCFMPTTNSVLELRVVNLELQLQSVKDVRDLQKSLIGSLRRTIQTDQLVLQATQARANAAQTELDIKSREVDDVNVKLSAAQAEIKKLKDELKKRDEEKAKAEIPKGEPAKK